MVDALVIGGGIIGASCAYHLAQSDVGDVHVLERDGLASKATGRSAGFITPDIFNEFSTGNRIGRYCRTCYERLETSDATVESHSKRAYTIAHSDGGVSELQALQERTDAPCERITPEELARREADLSTDGVTAALAFDEATHVDPYSVTVALLDAVETDVTVIREGVEAIRSSSSGFVVETGAKTYDSSVVVIAAGAWSNELLGHLGLSYPMMPRYSQVAVFDATAFADFPFLNYPDLGLYAREEPTGDVIVGGGPPIEVPDPDDFTTRANESFLLELVEKAPKVSTALLDAKKRNDWAGRCTATPDYHPIIGESSVDGCYICAGFNGGGVMHAPFAGRLLADHVTGSEPTFDPEPFSPSRASVRMTDEFTIGKTALSW